MDRQTVRRPFALIVDDDPLILEVAERAFRAFGFTTLVTRNPEEALEIAMALLPDLVLTDALMPRLDGRELCLRLKNCAATRKIKVVVMSALYRGTTYRNQAFRAFGVDEFLAKPIKPVVLRDVLERILPHLAARRPSIGQMQVAS
jgi:CheY-like chemotaxis protein